MTDDTDKETAKAEKSRRKAVASMMTGGAMTSANIIERFINIGDHTSAIEYAEVLNERIEDVNNGDLADLEAILVAQSAALNAIFMNTAMLAKSNMGEHFTAATKFMTMAMKAQNQCRMTVETLSEMKNPKPYIQNNRAVNQQINNGASPPKSTKTDQYTQARACAGKNANQSNELLSHTPSNPAPTIEDSNYETVDRSGAREASRDDKTMATMET